MTGTDVGFFTVVTHKPATFFGKLMLCMCGLFALTVFGAIVGILGGPLLGPIIESGHLAPPSHDQIFKDEEARARSCVCRRRGGWIASRARAARSAGRTTSVRVCGRIASSSSLDREEWRAWRGARGAGWARVVRSLSPPRHTRLRARGASRLSCSSSRLLHDIT
jgi:hypothetical protein